MSKPQKDRDYLSFLKTVGDIGTYTAAIIAYLLAITGRAPTPYPNTVAFITALVTVIAVWLWRLPRITASSTARSSPSKTKPRKNSPAEKDPKPQRLRNLEITGLSFLSVAVLVLGGFRFPTMQEEVTGLNCLNPPSDFRVMIANMASSPEQSFENRLGNTLARQAQGLLQVCRYLREVDFIDDIYSLQGKYGMDLVISGEYSSDGYEIDLTPAPEFDYSHAEGLPIHDTDDQVAFLTSETIAVVYFVQGKLPEAQTHLRLALDTARSQGWAEDNPTLLADGYFLMGQILSANEPAAPSDLDPAVNAYAQAIKLVPNLEVAYWNQADLYVVQNRPEEAISNYDDLIDLDGKYAIEARMMKAQLILESGDCLAASETIEQTLQMPGVDQTHESYPNLIYVLGKSRLQCKDYPGAEQAFEKMPPIAPELAPAYIEDLNAIAEESNDPLLKEEISKIVKLIQQKISP